MSGYLEIILGPMFSGKTTRLVEIYNKHIHADKKIIAVNYSADKRYHESMLSTHDKVFIPCIFSDSINELFSNNNFMNADVILINEGQFFSDIYDSVKQLVEVFNKKVYVCGLDSDFRRQKFGDLLNLITLCDNVVKLHSSCSKCNNEAIFSHRLSNEDNQVVIGSDNYKPLCRNCYLNSNAH